MNEDDDNNSNVAGSSVNNNYKREQLNLKAQMKYFSNTKNKFRPKPFINIYK